MTKREAALTMRAKILGVLIKDSRLAAGRTARECAEAMGVSLAIYNAYEQGRKTPSLPELELLAFFVNVPLAHFWGSEIIADPSAQRDPAALPATQVTRLRDRIIGAQLRRARLAAKLKLKAFAAELGLTGGRLSAYEFGRRPIPFPELELITARLGLNLEDLLERQGPVGEWDSARRDFERFRQLPDDLREFVSLPLNETYLRLAQRLSAMPADQLRGIAESLLDITL